MGRGVGDRAVDFLESWASFAVEFGAFSLETKGSERETPCASEGLVLLAGGGGAC